MRQKTFTAKVAKKSNWSFVLLLFGNLLAIPLFRNILIHFGLPHCRNIVIEPGFRFYNGKNIYATDVSFGNVLIMDFAEVTIGEDSAFAKDCKILTGKHDLIDRPKIIACPIHIGKSVWVSSNVLILPGVDIGDNSVIGAGSVVTHDIPANCLVAGNPAKIIRRL